MQDFGVVVACHHLDYYLAKACCASIRHYLGEVAIILLADGDFATDDLERTYGVSVIRRNDIEDPELRRRSFGWGLTKMLAFWAAPCRSFLVLDADTIVIGDVLHYAAAGDLVVDCHTEQLFPSNPLLDSFLGAHRLTREPRLHAHVARWFFDPALMRREYPSFPLESTVGRLFCSGCFFGKRDGILRDDYLAALDAAERVPGLFAPGEMGLLNFLAFRAQASGALRLSQEPDLQALAHLLRDEDAARRFPMEDGEPSKAIERPGVLHWSGWNKPHAQDMRPHARLVSFFRRRFLRDSGYEEPRISAILASEDRERLQRIRRRANGHVLAEVAQ